ncbi:hypothetical protein DPMN_188702 [Dreissena polymorpha]|uniref:Uncharacterized protein n=1 Tax=Dreissena polymorpha TaxID=45954 RepID=A0A9D4IAA5_DREPO|nr:hypothetical protein DPMN_188702 [Dreissena polymorpha]
MFLPTFMTSEQPGSHVFLQTLTIFIHIQDEKCPAPGGHIFQATGTIFELVQDIIGTNLLTMFHDDWTIITASRVLTRKKATPPWYIIGTNRLTKFQDDRTINVASRVLIRKNVPPPGGHTNLLTRFHEDWTINVASRVLTFHIRTNLLTKFHEDRKINVANVFQPTGIIFELVKDIVGMNLLTKFNENQTINVAPITNLLTKFHENWTISLTKAIYMYSHIRKNALPPVGHVFKVTEIIFKLIQDIIGTNLLIKFHEDRKINVASRVLTRKNACPLHHFKTYRTINVASRVHVFQANLTILELIQDIIETNLLTKFHEDGQ